VQVDVLVQRLDAAGSATFVTNSSVDLRNIAKNNKQCAFLHPLSFDFDFGSIAHVDDMKQNSLPWSATVSSEFDAEVSLLAFPYDDNTTRAERAELAQTYGERVSTLVVASTESYDKAGLADAVYTSSTRVIEQQELRAAYSARGGVGADGVSVVCDAACHHLGGMYQSWHPHVVLEWNVTATAGNSLSVWADVAGSTWGKPLRIIDERRYFAVS